MFKTGQLVGFAVVAVLALSGCASAGASADVAKSAAPEVAAAAEATEEPAAAPITMEPAATEDQTEAQKAGFVDENDWYLRSIKSSWSGDLPTDDQLLGAAALACASAQDGAAADDIVVVQGEGDDAFYNNRNAVNYAIMALCPA